MRLASFKVLVTVIRTFHYARKITFNTSFKQSLLEVTNFVANGGIISWTIKRNV